MNIELSNLEIAILRTSLEQYRKNLREEQRASRFEHNQAWTDRVNDKINAALAVEEKLSA